MPPSVTPTTVQAATGLAERLLMAYASENRDILPLFAAFVGLVYQRDEAVGNDCLIALDRLICGDVSREETRAPFV
jgi:hypothetical protein